jgi:hypothetical protein
MHPLRSEIGPVARTAQQAPRFLRALHQTLVDAGAGHWAALRRLSVLHRPPHPPPHAAPAPALPQNRRFFRKITSDGSVMRDQEPPTAHISVRHMCGRRWEAGERLATRSSHARDHSAHITEQPICTRNAHESVH